MLGGLKGRLLGFFIAEDEAANALIGPGEVPAAGNPHYTISQRLAFMRQKGSRVGCIGCAALTWIQNKVFKIPGDHCADAIKDFPADLPTEA